MREMIIRRVAVNHDGVFGVIIDGVIPFALTLENEWRNNERNVSCIPEGRYLCKRYSSQKYPDTFEITKVPNRSYILFHTGNTDEDTAGCVLIAEEFGELNKETAILSSKKGFKEFMARLTNVQEFYLTVVRAY